MRKVSFSLLAISCLALGCAKFDGMDVGDGTTSGTQDSGLPADPAVYFASSVVPAIKKSNQCAACHALPKDSGTASLGIYEYTPLRELLVAGPVANSRTTLDNGLMPYFQGMVLSHAGGRVFCTGALTASPCKEVREWAKLEGLKVADYAFATPAPYGRVYGAELDGAIWGWAADPDTANTPMTVEFYIDGARGVGTALGDEIANRPFSTLEKRGNVGFRFVLPDLYQDSTAHTVYIYGVDNNTPNTVHALAGSPIQITAYRPSQTAQNYYEATVLPILQNRTCTNCHLLSEFSYQSTFYYHFLSPPPHMGGTATSSVLYRKMFGTQSHRGGAHCGGDASAGLCGALINSWNLEFN
jgi:hypothetical protein